MGEFKRIKELIEAIGLANNLGVNTMHLLSRLFYFMFFLLDNFTLLHSMRLLPQTLNVSRLTHTAGLCEFFGHLAGIAYEGIKITEITK